ncbi:hypothetical protein KCH_67280 [Kitasatospora cheerisanensis KCTC 2395]|uniref:Uncharacterized protein n=1 Tax=Kitasatospora cheerisanensis KCTC 2395 TaxID=1348663 RepID=A0A066YU80_9ACTN|nr:hypothetical protein KCH_67280 [Kitasatospora cheerisanensis KCTC 2395]
MTGPQYPEAPGLTVDGRGLLCVTLLLVLPALATATRSGR